MPETEKLGMFVALFLALLLGRAAARRRRRGARPDPIPEVAAVPFATRTPFATSTPEMTPPATPPATWEMPIKMDRYVFGITVCLGGISVSLVLVTYSVLKQCTVIGKSRLRSEGLPLMGGAPRGLL
jgi:hypothetical protein